MIQLLPPFDIYPPVLRVGQHFHVNLLGDKTIAAMYDVRYDDHYGLIIIRQVDFNLTCSMTLRTGEARIMCFDETIILIFSAYPAGAVSFGNSRLRFLLLLLGGPAALLGEPSVASLPIPSVVFGLAAFVVAAGFEKTRTKSPSGSKVYRVEGIAKPWRLT